MPIAVSSATPLRALVLAAALLLLPLVAASALADDDASSSPGTSAPSADEVAGQVVGINTLAPRPLVQVANLDGTVNLYFISVDQIVMAGVRYGDHISALGRKINELEFEVDVEAFGSEGRILR